MNDLEQFAPQIATASTEHLRSELARVLKISARDLLYLAAIWKELEHRGEDLSELKRGMGVYLPMIAAGVLEAEIVVKYAGHRMLLNAIAELPIGTQKSLAEGRALPLVVHSENDGWVARDVPVDAMTVAQVKQVIESGRIRTTEEQFAKLAKAGEKELRKRKAARGMRVDRKTSELVVGRARIPFAAAMKALRDAGLLAEA